MGKEAQQEVGRYQDWNDKLEAVKPQPIDQVNMQQIVRMEVGQELDRVVDAIRGIPVADLSLTEEGLQKHYKKALQGQQYRNQFFRRS